ncbi:hepatic lectin-like isoform X2 [Clupea harengus]|uniref:Hepatic lectin-like isoform X1 n=1 Tax=Clupea harengus TaxID=7950 RepID=A0A6P3VVU0_CLUHA|nr:hepatic lectin-like isoform X1 [Clupea harengus]XP_042564230.1 hepatic lectin-like isoform X2 [Clupea harengus]
MESVNYDRFSGSDTENLHHNPRLVPLKGRQNRMAYILYGLLLLLLLILLMITGIKFSQLSQGIEDIKIYLTTAKSSPLHSPFSQSPQQEHTGEEDFIPHFFEEEQGDCHSGWLSFKDHCYYLSTQKTNWHSAEQRCIEQSGLLFVPNTSEEMEYITEVANEAAMYWFGLVEYGQEGNWTLVDGTDFETVPKFWDNNQPDDWHVRLNGEDCAQLHPHIKRGLRRWNDADCTLDYLYICEAKLKG